MAEKPAPKKRAVAPKLKPVPVKEEVPTWKLLLKFFAREVYKVMTSTLGMVSMLIVYAFIGAVLFKVIEGTYENHQKKVVQQVGMEILDNVWNTSLAVKRNEAAFKLVLKAEMKKYETALFEAYSQGISTTSDTRVWDFWGSLFYSATIVTTIGYGHISPVTDWGRIATMLYSVIGIPLCLITMADLGKLLTRAIKYLWSFVRRLYYTGRCLKAKFIKPPPTEEGSTAAPTETLPPDEPYVVDDEFNLPIIVAIMVVIVYIFLGALFYCQWEQWTYLEAFYFIFISVSTIGFGDVLPEHPKYFLASSLYVLMGLSLVAMVINVIMDDMNARLEKAKDRMAEVSRTIGLSIEEEDSSHTTTVSAKTSPKT